MFSPEKEGEETALRLDGEANNAPTVIWKIICALSEIFAICEST